MADIRHQPGGSTKMNAIKLISNLFCIFANQNDFNMKFLGILIIMGLIVWIGLKIQEWDSEKHDGFGCFVIGMIFMLVITTLGGISMCKSCISDSNQSPGYDYYDDRAR